MHLSDDMLRTVGFVVRDGETVGTCFLVRVQSELHPDRPSWDHGYLITAAHVVPPDGRATEVWMPTRDGQSLKTVKPEWRYPEGDADGADIAAAAFVEWEGNPQWSALEMYKNASDRLGIRPLVGADIQYVGLLKPIRSMAGRGQPMVRSATLGALDVENVSYDGWCAKRAHLIDCRSRKGFSGSPCFVIFSVPGPMIGPFPAAWREAVAPRQLGSVYYFAALFGMFVGYGDDDGVGIVIPIEYMHDIVNLGVFETMRRERDEQRSKDEAQQGNGFEAVSADDPDRVSLAPLEFEDALKGLLATPPDTDAK